MAGETTRRQCKYFWKLVLTCWNPSFCPQTQLTMMLELLAEHHQNFQAVNKRMDDESERNFKRFQKLDGQVADLGSQLKAAQEEIREAVSTVKKLDTKVNSMEERLENKIADVRSATEAVRVRTGALELRVAGIEPQIKSLQTEQLRQAEENKDMFKKVHEKVYASPASVSRALSATSRALSATSRASGLFLCSPLRLSLH